MNYKGKKLLILAGAGVHRKVVEAAKELGIYTIVTDYLDDSPAKRIADESWDLSITDVEGIVERCREKEVDGVINLCIDPGQIPYQAICQKLNFPCYGTKEQFEILTNKRKFKDFCVAHGVGVISEFSLEDVELQRVNFPVFVKPVDSRGSRGQMICNNYADLSKAIAFAERASTSGGIIIETYIENKTSFQVTYFFVNGKPHLVRTVDGYKGTIEDKLDRVALCSVSPSKYTDIFIETANDAFVDMLKALGIKNGPVMVQGFYDNGVFRFYDPGLRFPGTDFEMVYKALYDIDLMQAMVIFALTGEMPDLCIDNNAARLNGKRGAVLFPTLRSGCIGLISGVDALKNDSRIISCHVYHKEGDVIQFSNTTEQRIAEVDILADKDLNSAIAFVQQTLDVRDENGMSMIYSPFQTERLND